MYLHMTGTASSTFIVQSKINHYNTVQKPVPTIPFHHNRDTSGPFTFTTAQQNLGNEKDFFFLIHLKTSNNLPLEGILHGSITEMTGDIS